jgi:hypothetical protein
VLPPSEKGTPENIFRLFPESQGLNRPLLPCMCHMCSTADGVRILRKWRTTIQSTVTGPFRVEGKGVYVGSLHTPLGLIFSILNVLIHVACSKRGALKAGQLHPRSLICFLENKTHIRQSRPDRGLEFQVKFSSCFLFACKQTVISAHTIGIAAPATNRACLGDGLGCLFWRLSFLAGTGVGGGACGAKTAKEYRGTSPIRNSPSPQGPP